MTRRELEAELSDLKARYLYASDKRQLKQLRERIDHVARQLKILDQREGNADA